jgi:putative ABC transport system permease protein
MTRLPRVPTWLLSAVLPAGDRDQIIGDLAEDFAAIEAEHGRRRAVRWYWRHTAGLVSSLGFGPSRQLTPPRSPMMSFDQARFAIRRLRKQPGATLGSIVTLAIAIGAAVSVWSLLSAVLLHPLPVRDDDSLVAVAEQPADLTLPAARRVPQLAHIYPLYPIVRDAGVFGATAAYANWPTLVESTGPAAYRPASYVTHDFFTTLGLSLQLGRGFLETDDRRGASPVVIVSNRFWRTELNGSRDVLGRTLVVGNVKAAATIVGVAPNGFRGMELADAPDIYLPFHVIVDLAGGGLNAFAEADTGFSPTAFVHVIGRLKPGSSRASTTVGLAAIAPRFRADRLLTTIDIQSASLAESARPQVTRFARLLALTVSLLLLIGCLTVGTMLLLRSEARRDEFAMCLALGATRRHLAIGIVVEGALLAGGAMILALPVSGWFLAGLRSFELPGGVSMALLEIPVDGRTFVAAAAFAAMATLAVSLVAGVFGLSANVSEAIRSRTGATQRIGRRRTRGALVVAEIAVALVLLSGAGLFARSLGEALKLNAGFDPARLVAGTVSLRSLGYSADRSAQFFDELRERLDGNGVIASASFTLQMGGMSANGKLVIDGTPKTVPSFVGFTAVDDRYFPTIGLAVSKGRNFTDTDAPGAALVGIVSESFGRFIADGGDPIGHRIKSIGGMRPGQAPPQIEIVGVVPDIVTSVRALEPLQLYTPIAQTPLAGSRSVMLRAKDSASAATHEAVGIVHDMAPSLAPPAFRTLQGQIASQMGPQRFGATVLGALGGIAALLTLFGTYVLAESMSAIRRREMGIRAALGATRAELGRLIMAETVRLVGLGVAVGLGLSWIGANLIREFLFQITPFDPITLGSVLAGVLLLALAVTLKPAIRAGAVDLSKVLREQ